MAACCLGHVPTPLLLQFQHPSWTFFCCPNQTGHPGAGQNCGTIFSARTSTLNPVPLNSQNSECTCRVELNDIQVWGWFGSPRFEKAKVIKIRKTSYSIENLDFTLSVRIWLPKWFHEQNCYMSNSNSTQSRVQLFIKSVLGDLEEDLGKEETDQGLISITWQLV